LYEVTSFCLVVVLFMASSVSGHTRAEVFSEPGLKEDRAYSSLFPYEHIDVGTGDLP
jgi:hypothetical protein